MMRLLAPMLLFVLLSAQAQAVDLTVRLDGVEPRGGSLRVGLFDSQEGFAKRKAGTIATRSVSADGDEVVVRFEGLPPGRYAVTAFHDQNDNRVLDRFAGLVPREGVALGNDARMLPPPRFDDLAVEVVANREVTLRVRYPRG